jgi:hypothetical protein
LGVTSLIAYFVSRKAAVVFWIARRDSIQTIQGGPREVADLMQAIEQARAAFESQTATAIAS